MNVITIDFESFWSPTYSLSVMSPLEYVLGPEFETISCAIKVNDGPSRVFFGHGAVAAEFAKLDIANSALLAHNNAGFDCYIAAYRFGLKPKLWLDTAAMARPIHAKTIGVSLAKLVQHYGVGVKNNAVLIATRGKHLADFTPQELADMAKYNGEDTDQCYALFQILRPLTPAAELWNIDLTARMRVEPAFELDVPLLQRTLEEERAHKREIVLELATTLTGMTPDLVKPDDEPALVELVRAELASSAKMAALLEKRGVEVPMKPSPTNPDKRVPALAKTDEEFVALQEHEDPVVQTAARARLAIKSTLLETRIGKFITAAQLSQGRLPVPIRYAGADTSGRDSGEEYNCLNLPRITPGVAKRTDALRNSLRAPKGKKIIVADQSNIELRVNHTLWRVPSSMKLWADKPDADLYTASAASRWNIPPEAVTKPQRQMAKIENLGLGFGSGAETFRKVAKQLSGGKIDLSKTWRYATQDEIDALPPDTAWPMSKDGYPIVILSDPAQESVDAWRADYPEIVEGWAKCDEALWSIARGERIRVDPKGLVYTSREGFELLGYTIRYPNLRREEQVRDGRARMQWVYADGRHKAGIYGSKADENIVQSIARRIVVVDNTIEFYKRTGLRPALRPYDELVYVVDEAAAEELLAELQDVMRTPLPWWPELTVWSEGSIGDTYGAAK